MREWRVRRLGIGTIVQVLRLGRLHFVFGGFLLYLFGVMLAISAGADLDGARFAWGYAVVFCAHLSVSYSNDHFDADVDQRTRPTLFSGGSKVLVEHPELRRLSWGIAVGLIAISLTLGAAFIWMFGYPVWFYGLIALGNLLGWYYSAPPAKLAYRGMGEISTMVTAGLLLPAVGYTVVAGTLDLDFLVVLPTTLLYGLVFIINVQIPDIEADRLAGKATLVSRRGRVWAFEVTGVLMALATVYLVSMAVLGGPLGLPYDFGWFAVVSMITLATGMMSLIRRTVEVDSAGRLVTNNVSSIFLLLIVLNLYLILA
jgi:1,4-dihydroxy-2-naphthoate octaprenyltransferase